MESVLALMISAGGLGFSILMYMNSNGRRTNERLTKLESAVANLVNTPERLTRIETVADYSHTRITSLEDELKDMMREIKEMQIEILRNTKV